MVVSDTELHLRSLLEALPAKFLEVRCTTIVGGSESISLCAGYEGEAWRAKKLAGHIFAWLPFVALDQTRKDTLAAANWYERVQLAAAHIYKTRKTKSRGEIGEILLHIACMQEFKTEPILCKLILKTSHNDTVKGFDAVHLAYNETGFEIWLGESKFYDDPKQAISESLKSIREHLLPSFLDTEKAMLYGHIGSGVPYSEEVQSLFHQNISSDELLKKAVFPVLIAYQSDTIAKNKKLCDELVEQLQEEVSALHGRFMERASDINIRLQLIFFPMHLKSEVIKYFDQKLEAFS